MSIIFTAVYTAIFMSQAISGAKPPDIPVTLIAEINTPYRKVCRQADRTIHVADFRLNAVHAVDSSVNVEMLRKHGDTNGHDGQPAFACHDVLKTLIWKMTLSATRHA